MKYSDFVQIQEEYGCNETGYPETFGFCTKVVGFDAKGIRIEALFDVPEGDVIPPAQEAYQTKQR